MNQTLAILKNISWSSWSKDAIALAQTGQLPNYVPILAKANPESLGMVILSKTEEIGCWGDINQTFPLMSVIKPFLLLYQLSLQGEEWVNQKVGKKPSSLPFNSLLQLENDDGFPRNSMINSGAIRLAAELPGNTARDRTLALQNWLNQNLKNPLFLDEQVLASVQSVANTKNQALAQTMARQGHLENWPLALETYNQICCLSGTVLTLAELGQLLINSPSPLSTHNCQLVLEIMTTCGLYEASENFAQQIGFPSKSGVSGIILAIIPNQAAIAIYSPPLDQQGNSRAGLYLLQKIAKLLN